MHRGDHTGDEQGEFKPHPYGHNVHGVAARILGNREAVQARGMVRL